MRKHLMDFTDEELDESLVQNSQNVVYSYNDIRLEIERRTQQANANRVFDLAKWAFAISVVSLILSVLVALFKT